MFEVDIEDISPASIPPKQEETEKTVRIEERRRKKMGKPKKNYKDY